MLNIIYLTTEAVPFAKTGGLADVCGTLPAKIAALGHRCAVVMPAFQSIHKSGLKIESSDTSFAISMSDRRLVGARLLHSKLPDSDVPVWFIDQPQYFDRPGLYGDGHGDFRDNAERFAFFCRAAIHAISRSGWSVDLVHCNDWQSGLVPALIKNMRGTFAESQHPWIREVASMMTIHNLAYQGQFPKEDYRWVGQDWSHFRPEEYEFYDQLNFLKTGIVAADRISTVSDRYAHEICGPELGCGLDRVLTEANDRMVGIPNGIDIDVWNPSTDPLLSANYDAGDWKDGKAANKLDMQKNLGLDQSKEVPVIGLVGRLAQQKGWDLIVPVLRWHLTQDRPTQWVVLGSGDPQLEHALNELAHEYPNRFGLHVGFNNELAHQIEAAADLFLMPSHYEPCGLNQLYSLRYGTIPVVTPTGGLADTVVDCSPETLENKTATGFYVREKTPQGLDDAIGRALQLRYHEPKKWELMIKTAMSQDWSWRKSARQYADVYEQTISLS